MCVSGSACEGRTRRRLWLRLARLLAPRLCDSSHMATHYGDTLHSIRGAKNNVESFFFFENESRTSHDNERNRENVLLNDGGGACAPVINT